MKRLLTMGIVDAHFCNLSFVENEKKKQKETEMAVVVHKSAQIEPVVQPKSFGLVNAN